MPPAQHEQQASEVSGSARSSPNSAQALHPLAGGLRVHADERGQRRGRPGRQPRRGSVEHPPLVTAPPARGASSRVARASASSGSPQPGRCGDARSTTGREGSTPSATRRRPSRAHRTACGTTSGHRPRPHHWSAAGGRTHHAGVPGAHSTRLLAAAVHQQPARGGPPGGRQRLRRRADDEPVRSVQPQSAARAVTSSLPGAAQQRPRAGAVASAPPRPRARPDPRGGPGDLFGEVLHVGEERNIEPAEGLGGVRDARRTRSSCQASRVAMS